MDPDLNIIAKIIKLLKENTGLILDELSLGMDSNNDTKSTNKKNINWASYKSETFVSKDTIKK